MSSRMTQETATTIYAYSLHKHRGKTYSANYSHISELCDNFIQWRFNYEVNH